jgi:phage head maturation protease
MITASASKPTSTRATVAALLPKLRRGDVTEMSFGFRVTGTGTTTTTTGKSPKSTCTAVTSVSCRTVRTPPQR